VVVQNRRKGEREKRSLLLTEAMARTVVFARHVLRERGLTDDQIEAELNRVRRDSAPF
jgi:hypothetical protein